MTTHLYTLCWNEADMLGFFFRHYDPWVDRYVVYDDGSTDGSLDILKAHPKVEVRSFVRTTSDSFVASQTELQNHIWRESCGKADWTIITALDEHLTIKSGNNARYLVDCAHQGVTLIPAIGFQMLSDEYPRADEVLCATRTIGAPWSVMSKLSIFNPDAITDTGFTEGRHLARPSGDVRYPLRDEMMLLHYKYVDFERTLERHHIQAAALGTQDVARSWGEQYHWSRQQLRANWDRFLARAVDTGPPDFDPAQHCEEPRWWRIQIDQPPPTES